jgi:hypothetical protein
VVQWGGGGLQETHLFICSEHKLKQNALKKVVYMQIAGPPEAQADLNYSLWRSFDSERLSTQQQNIPEISKSRKSTPPKKNKHREKLSKKEKIKQQTKQIRWFEIVRMLRRKKFQLDRVPANMNSGLGELI